MKKIILGLLATVSFGFSQGCWTVVEKSELEYDELNDKITFSIKDALTCKEVSKARVSFGGVELLADEMGEFNVPLNILEDGQKIILKVAKQGYIPFVTKLEVEVGTIRGNKILLSPKLAPTSVRFVLGWGSAPKDLDIHMVAPDYHISFHDKKSVRNKAKLDRDAMHGFGPETITLQEVKDNEAYTVYVNRFSREGEIDGDAQVQVYIDNHLDRVVQLPKTDKRAVKVMTLHQGRAIYHNTPVDRIP